jgi:hypothetical protein
MATATVVRSESFDPTDVVKSVAVVNVDGVDVSVEYWYGYVDAYGPDGMKQLLCAEALWVCGAQSEARAVLETAASGDIVYDETTLYYDDQRNWQKRWLDDHPIAATPTSVVDPLL